MKLGFSVQGSPARVALDGNVYTSSILGSCILNSIEPKSDENNIKYECLNVRIISGSRPYISNEAMQIKVC